MTKRVLGWLGIGGIAGASFLVGGFSAFAYFFVWSFAPSFDLWLPFDRVFECATR